MPCKKKSFQYHFSEKQIQSKFKSQFLPSSLRKKLYGKENSALYLGEILHVYFWSLVSAKIWESLKSREPVLIMINSLDGREQSGLTATI